jgi:excisionase family DNA binding protein
MCNHPNGRLLTVAQAATKMSVSQNTIRRWIRTGIVPGHKINGVDSVRVYEADLDRLITPMTDPPAEGTTRREPTWGIS